MGLSIIIIEDRKSLSIAKNQPKPSQEFSELFGPFIHKIKGFTFGRKKAHKHKLFALVNVQMALGQTAGCPRVHRANKFMCSPRNTGNINFSLWLTGGLSQGCPDFQRVYVFKVYVHLSCPITRNSARKIHPNFAQNLGRQIIGNTFYGLKIF